MSLVDGLSAVAFPAPAENVERQLKLTAQRLRVAWDDVPQPWPRVRIVPDLTSVKPGHDGAYFPGAETILVRHSGADVLRHELGHWLAAKALHIPAHTAESEAQARRAEGRWLWWLPRYLHRDGPAPDAETLT